MKSITIDWRLRAGSSACEDCGVEGLSIADKTVLEAEANPRDPAESIEAKVGVFLIQLAAQGGYLIKMGEVELHE